MAVVGVVLAGGAGTRMGGGKALAELDGAPLLLRPLGALAAVTARQAVVAKAATGLPGLPEGVAVWREPDLPVHPLTGVLHALRSAAGAEVLACAVDLALLDPATLRHLLAGAAATPGADCVVPVVAGRVQPLCALWRPGALAGLAALPDGVRMRDAVAGAHQVAFSDPTPFTNVNTPGDLARLSRT